LVHVTFWLRLMTRVQPPLDPPYVHVQVDNAPNLLL
jgi:hypothetical protein